MKKTLRKSFFGKALGAVSLALLGMSLLLAGCENVASPDSAVTTGVSIPQLPAPGNVRAVAYDGIVFVSWVVVKDATGYQVYRRDSVTGAVYVASTGWTINAAASTSFIDTVSFSTPLVNGRSYTYTVVAKSGQSTGTTSADSGMTPYGGNEQSLILNSVASASVNAKVPDRATYTIPAPTALETSIVRDGSFGSDSLEKVLVVWKAELNAKYDVSYTFGAGDVAYTYYLEDKEDDGTPIITGAGTELGSVKFPLVGGKTTVTVGPYFIGDRDFYKTGAPITKELNENLSTLTAPTLADTDTDNDFPKRDGPNVVIKWNEVTGAASGAAGYAVYKAEFERADSWNVASDDHSSSNIAIKSDWTTVTITGAVLSGTTYTAVDYNVPLDKDYVYLIIAKHGDIKSAPRRFFIGKDTLAAAPDWEPIPVDANTKVQVAFPVETGKTYALARATVTFTDAAIAAEDGVKEDTPPATIGEWTNVTATVSDNPAYKVFIDTPAKRSSYQYRLNVTEGGVTKSYYKNLYEDPFFVGAVKVAFKTSSEDDSVSGTGVASSIETYKAITLKFDFEVSDTDLFFNVYRAKWDNIAANDKGGVTTKYEKITSAPVAVSSLIDNEWEDKDAALVVGVWYSYRFEVLSSATSTTALKNTAADDKVEGHVRPATAESNLEDALPDITFAIGETGASTSKIAVIFESGSSNYPVLKGAKFYAIEQVDDGLVGSQILLPSPTYLAAARKETDDLGALDAKSVYFDLPVTTLPKATYAEGANNVRTYNIYTEAVDGSNSKSYLVVTVTSISDTSVTMKISNNDTSSDDGPTEKEVTW
jgi:hypothetical protein